MLARTELVSLILRLIEKVQRSRCKSCPKQLICSSKLYCLEVIREALDT